MKKYLIVFLILVSTTNCFSQCHSFFSSVINSFSPPVVTFTDQSTDTLSGIITNWSWDFGDGQTSTSQNPVHTYAATGNYNVCLVISTSTGCNDSRCMNVYVIPPVPGVVAVLVPDSNAQLPCTAPASIQFMYEGYFTAFSPPDSALIHVFFGDGLDSTFYRVMDPWISGYFNHIFQNSGTYYPTIIITAPTGVADTFASPQVFIGSSCGNITGKIYKDNNGNCIFDAGDVVMPNVNVYLNSGINIQNSAATDINGDYSFNVPPGPTYDVTLPSYLGSQTHWHVTCPSTLSYSITTVPSAGNDFVFTCLPGFDLEVFLYVGCLRPGFTEAVDFVVQNNRCIAPTGQIEVVFPPDLTPLPDSANSYIITGNIVTLPINPTEFYWHRKIPVLVSATATIGTVECITINATPVAGDVNPSNNTLTFCKQLAGSFDPNQKTVTPAGQGIQGAIDLGTDLTYTIDFQNTGTSEAVNIFILDTISPNLDLASIRILGSSHDMNWSILPGRILRLTFNNIMLPDSNTNEFESHGYVSYSIDQAPNLANQTVINNTAGIYFDFNSPVITNTTVNTIDLSLGINNLSATSSFEISPMPASQSCKIKFNNSGIKTMNITDYSGKLILSSIVKNDECVLNLNDFENGIYLVTIFDSEKYIGSKKLIVQK